MAAGRELIRFPLPMAAALGLMRRLPDALYDLVGVQMAKQHK